MFTVKVVSHDATSPNARAGLLLRDDVTGPGRTSGYVVLAVKPQNGFLLLWIGRATVPHAASQQDAAVFVTSHDPALGLVSFEGFTVTAAQE